MPRTPGTRTAVRAVLTVLAALTVSLGLAAPALAHVTVNTGGEPAVKGGYAKLVFRAPNESDSAAFGKLKVVFPRKGKFGHVSVKPQPGWSYQVTTSAPDRPIQTGHGEITEIVTSVTWTADSAEAAIKPGEFGEFAVSVGPLPEANQLAFPAIQTYEDGEVSKWNQIAAGGAPEPDSPAPLLELAVDDSTGASDATPAAATSPSSGEPGSGSALTVAVVALVVAVIGAAGALVSLRRSVRA